MWAPNPSTAAPVFFFEDEDNYSALKVDSFTFFDDALVAAVGDADSKKSGSESTLADTDRNFSSASSNDDAAEGKRAFTCCCDHRSGARCACESLAALPPLILSCAGGPSPLVTECSPAATGKGSGRSPALRPLKLAPLKLEGFTLAPQPATTTATATTTTSCCRC